MISSLLSVLLAMLLVVSCSTKEFKPSDFEGAWYGYVKGKGGGAYLLLYSHDGKVFWSESSYEYESYRELSLVGKNIFKNGRMTIEVLDISGDSMKVVAKDDEYKFEGVLEKQAEEPKLRN